MKIKKVRVPLLAPDNSWDGYRITNSNSLMVY